MTLHQSSIEPGDDPPLQAQPPTERAGNLQKRSCTIKTIVSPPRIRDRIKRFVDDTNPLILQQAKAGHRSVFVYIADYRIAELRKLEGMKGFGEQIEFKWNGSSIA